VPPARPLPTAVVIVLVAAAVACGGRGSATLPELPLSREVVDLVLPSADGAEVELARWRGHPVVVHFATTSALDVQADIEELRRTRERAPDLVLVEIVLDEGGERMAAPWADASGIDWAVLLPTPQLVGGGSAFGRIRIVPTTFLLDREGRIAWRWEGALQRGLLPRKIAELR
jgi:riboflavin biosynthesis pyrimidine reductase